MVMESSGLLVRPRAELVSARPNPMMNPASARLELGSSCGAGSSGGVVFAGRTRAERRAASRSELFHHPPRRQDHLVFPTRQGHSRTHTSQPRQVLYAAAALIPIITTHHRPKPNPHEATTTANPRPLLPLSPPPPKDNARPHARGSSPPARARLSPRRAPPTSTHPWRTPLHRRHPGSAPEP